MAHLRDDSLLFSLKTLFDDEKERVLNEQRAREQRISEEAEERAANERRRMEAEQKRRDEEERRRFAEAQRQREEALRFEALKTAEVERARAEVQKRSQLEQATLDHQHQLKMAALAHEVRYRRQRWFVAFSSLLSFGLVMLGVSLYFGKLLPEQERLVASYEATLESERARLSETQRRLTELEQGHTALQTRFRAEKQRAVQHQQTAEHPSPAPVAHPVRTTRTRGGAVVRVSRPSSLDPNDPMNPTLGD